MQNIWAIQTDAQAIDDDWSVPVTPAAGAMGAYVDGIDLGALDADGLDEVRRLLHRFKAVMFRGQRPDLAWDGYVAFGRSFGDLAIDPYVEPVLPEHPEVMGLIREADATGYNFGGDWHSDGSYLEQPGGLTILWGLSLIHI